MKKILVIDDSEVNLYLIQTIFENDPDLVVEIESNSRKAFAKTEEGAPDVIILDLMMPHIDGFQLLEKFKIDPEIKKIPVIVLSAKQDQDSVNRALQLGASDYIKKPINLQVVENKIRHALHADSTA